MSNNGDAKSLGKTFLDAGKSLLQNRIQTQVHDYKLISIEKGSKIAATVIVTVIQVLMFTLFWIFGCFTLGFWLSYKVWGSFLLGFGAIAIGHLVLLFVAFILGKPVRYLIKTSLLAKLRED